MSASLLSAVPVGAIHVSVRHREGALELSWFCDGDAAQWRHKYTPGDGVFADRTEIVCDHCTEVGKLDLDAIMAQMRMQIGEAMMARDYLSFELKATVITQSHVAQSKT
jgi:hypothetical protein